MRLPSPGILGILNVTPDSFSDGGRYVDPMAAIARAEALAAEGADLIDIGGESTRPGAAPVGLEEEWHRIGAIVKALAPRFHVSVDTTKAEIARRSMDAGVVMINDVSAGRFDPGMLAVVASGGAAFVAMHLRGTPRTMQTEYVPYGDVVAEVRSFLEERVRAARAAGIRQVLVDPGLGFGKSAPDNWKLTAELGQLVGVADGVVYGCSRKRFLADLLPAGAPPEARDPASAAASAAALVAGADLVRVHAPALCREALSVVKQLRQFASS